jgi:hypothetical protein
MSIQKKSLISTLKTTKKANVASSDLDAKPAKVASAAAGRMVRTSKNTHRAIR